MEEQADEQRQTVTEETAGSLIPEQTEDGVINKKPQNYKQRTKTSLGTAEVTFTHLMFKVLTGSEVNARNDLKAYS